ncbi:tubulin delta [Cystoisospora suis]|uniref:Tubulin delta n=1 Tax=Cystoisospora suis TaxID=483139 RepID=A0A2C6LDA8_9APIC|nr:tubulin delta [Cystoisospora suis]
MRWLLLTGFCFCIPWGAAMYLGLWTERKKDRGLHQLGKLAAVLWALAWLVFLGLCIAVGVIILTSNAAILMPLRWDSPYHMRQTTRCGRPGASIKVEHAAMTHVLSEKTYGTVAFVGLMPAKTWVDAEVLEHVYKQGFDAVALSPPGIGATTNITNLKGSFYNDENFLAQVLESCLDIRLNTTVVVSHSNIVTRQFFFPLLMNRPLFGFVLFDSFAGDEWVTEVNPAFDDHEYYQPRTRNYRGRALPSIGMPRLLQAHQCVAEAEGELSPEWENVGPDYLGPYNFFAGKYKLSGWAKKEREFTSLPYDPAPDDKVSLLSMVTSGTALPTGDGDSIEQVERQRVARDRETPVEYFDELKSTLTEFLTEIKDRVDIGDYHPDRLPVVSKEARREAYLKARENTTLVDPTTIYCLEASPTSYSRVTNDSLTDGPTAPSLKPHIQGKPMSGHPGSRRPGQQVSSTTRGIETDKSSPSTSPRLRRGEIGGLEDELLEKLFRRSLPRERLGPPAPPVHPERFSASQKKKLQRHYAKLDTQRAVLAVQKRMEQAGWGSGSPRHP